MRRPVANVNAGMAWGGWRPAAVAMVTRLTWVAERVVMLRHPMGEMRGDQANRALGWLGDFPQHRDGPRQGPSAAPNPMMKAHTKAYYTFSHFSCFHPVWSKIRAALYQGLSRGRGGRAQWWAKGQPSLNRELLGMGSSRATIKWGMYKRCADGT